MDESEEPTGFRRCWLHTGNKDRLRNLLLLLRTNSEAKALSLRGRRRAGQLRQTIAPVTTWRDFRECGRPDRRQNEWAKTQTARPAQAYESETDAEYSVAALRRGHTDTR